MEKKVKKIIFLSLIILVFLFSFSLVFGQERKLEIEYPKIFGIKPETTKIGLPEYAKYIFNFSIAIVGLILFGVLIWAGFLYLTSAGQPAKLKEARERIVAAFLGAILLLSAYLILYLINPELVNLKLPILKPIEKVERQPAPILKPEEASLIVLELPLGQILEKKLWSKEKQQFYLDLIGENEKFFKEKTRIADFNLETISDLAKNLEFFSRECRCEETKGICLKPFNFGVPVACVGDPCPKKTREKIQEIVKILEEKQKKIAELQEKIKNSKKALQDLFSQFSGIENEIFYCQHELGALETFNEYLTTLNYFEEAGHKVKKITLPDAPPSVDDPLNFYCSVGGTLYDYFSQQRERTPPELPPEVTLPPLPKELEFAEFGQRKLNCPIEIPLGDILDKFRNVTYHLDFKHRKIIEHQTEMMEKLEKLNEYISECTNKDCMATCCNVPNPCFRCCSPIPCTICVPFCKSPGLQTVGSCSGKACPYDKIEQVIKEIKEIDDKVFYDLKSAKEIIERVPNLFYNPTESINLKNVREAIKACYSAHTEEPVWELLSCDEALNNTDANGQVITDCHPENFFCCTTRTEVSPPSEMPNVYYNYRIPATKRCQVPQEGLCSPEILEDYGWPKAQLEKAAITCNSESSGNPFAFNINSDAKNSCDFGLFQVNDYYHKQKFLESGFYCPRACRVISQNKVRRPSDIRQCDPTNFWLRFKIFEPSFNSKVGQKIFEEAGDFSPWYGAKACGIIK